ncbi:hypothetical protein RRG08_003892 [Elysia crispata]|uniref:Uncharacterized protein n=1 Tax=Elysia crispata TaxID=231223 RepID=A0AAE0ZEV5_9GAST|nr:hypothetical protein RRG08_003892 [Elysia crispata]
MVMSCTPSQPTLFQIFSPHCVYPSLCYSCEAWWSPLRVDMASKEINNQSNIGSLLTISGSCSKILATVGDKVKCCMPTQAILRDIAWIEVTPMTPGFALDILYIVHSESGP